MLHFFSRNIRSAILVSSFAFAVTGRADAASGAIRVLDPQGLPLPGAQVLIGNAAGDPFSGNVVKTDGRGLADAPSAWQTPLPLTVSETSATTRLTVCEAEPGPQLLQTLAKDGQEALFAEGTTSGFGKIKSDGNLHFGLVLPGLSREDLLHFDPTLFVSPYNDTLRIGFKSLDIPSNITIPSQTVTYVLPLTISKPDYRSYFRKQGTYQLTAIHGQFPTQAVVKRLQDGGSVFDVINSFTFLERGAREVTPTSDGAPFDLPVNGETFDSTITVQAPKLTALQYNFAVALTQKDGLLYPTDIKRLNSEERKTLKTTSDTSEKFVLSALVNGDAAGFQFKDLSLSPLNLSALSKERAASADFSNFSVILKSAGDTSGLNFIPIVSPPKVLPNQLLLTPPEAPQGVQPLATYLILSELQPAGDSETVMQRTRLWDVFAPGWVDKINLPRVVWKRESGKSYQWEVLFLGAQGAVTSGGLFENVTHVSRSAVSI